MTPKSFDIDTAKEIVGDIRMREIEAKARHDADNGIIDAPIKRKGTYWDGVSSDMEYVVYTNAHQKRIERIERISSMKKKEVNKLDEMWEALATYQPQADAEGHGKTWATMCQEKTSSAAHAVYVAWAGADATDATDDDSAYHVAWSVAVTVVSVDGATADADTAWASVADMLAQNVIDRINKFNMKETQT
jgi:hypothetical protein